MKIENLVIGLLLTVLAVGGAEGKKPQSEQHDTGSPSITITQVPPAGAGADTWGTIAGEVRGGNGKEWKVVIFAYGDTWYVQPWANSPDTSIGEDGQWETGTHLGFEYAALLVKSSYKPPATTPTLPNVGGDVLAIAKTTPNQSASSPAVRTLRFSDYEWTVKSSQGRVGPGPNYFSDSDNNVWVDAQGRLHLRITRRNNRWDCAEVISQRSFGYGIYRFYLDTPVDNLDPNIVLGLFTWNDEKAYSHREIDIEFSRWGQANNGKNAQYVIQPYTLPQHLFRFQIPSGLHATTHSFVWKKDSVVFQSFLGHSATPPKASDVIQRWTCFTSLPQAGGENARLNLWLVGGSAPTDSNEAEIIIKKFEFLPLKR